MKGTIRENLERIRRKIKRGDLGGIDMVWWHHIFCMKYGWISAEEFAEMPSNTFLNLAEKISEDLEAERKEYQKINKRRK